VATRFRDLNQGRGADLVIVCATAEKPFQQGLDAVGRGGTVLLFAPTPAGVTMPISINDLFWRRDVTLTTTYAAGPADCVAALNLIRHKRIGVEAMITHRFPLADTVKGFNHTAGAGDSIKVIIKPQQ
jgi:L-iditol 2-dehydrogenase